VIQVGKGAQSRFQARINPEVMPRLRVHDIYANALRQHRGNGRDASNYAALQQRLQEARWFIKNIQQRFDTILRVSTAIVERQKNFFLHGVLAMRPLVLPPTAKLTLEVMREATELLITVDGQVGATFSAGETLHVERSPNPILVARIDDEGFFFSRLREKLGWGGLADRD